MNMRTRSTVAYLAPTNRASLLTNKAFTLVEVIVILAVVSILVAIVTPTVLKYIAEAQQSRAEEDVRAISIVLQDLIKDTGQYPGSKLPIVATIQTEFLCGPGTKLGGAWGDDTTCADLTMHIVENDPSQDGTSGGTGDYRTTGRRKFKGPYVQILNEDPWGNAYQINATGLVGGNTSPTWIISAGPNGIFDTGPTATAISSDDMGVRLK